jgi:hypothetical protein
VLTSLMQCDNLLLARFTGRKRQPEAGTLPLQPQQAEPRCFRA